MILKNEIEEFEQVRHAFEGFGLPMAIKSKICLATEEAFVNVVSYAGASEIDVEIDCSKDMITITISDNGKVFDPTKIPPPVLDIDNLKPGGLGIEMIKRLMDSVSYNRKNEKNILTLKKNI